MGGGGGGGGDGGHWYKCISHSNVAEFFKQIVYFSHAHYIVQPQHVQPCLVGCLTHH